MAQIPSVNTPTTIMHAMYNVESVNLKHKNGQDCLSRRRHSMR